MEAIAHGASQATFAAIQGGDPFVGFASGALGSIAGSMYGGAGHWGGLGGKFGKTTMGTLLFSTAAGGAGAKLSGGNFKRRLVVCLAVSFCQVSLSFQYT